MPKSYDYSQLHWGKKLASEIFIVALIGIIMGFLGPFGTYIMPTGMRYAYWIIFGIVGYGLTRPSIHFIIWFADIIPMPKWFAGLLGCMLGALPFTLLVAYMIAGLKWDWSVISSNYALLYVQCTVLAFGIYMVMNIIFKYDDEITDAKTIEDKLSKTIMQNSRSKLHEYLPPSFPREIDALQSEDHYVHVYAHDDSGDHKEMILMRLSDAIKFLDGDGFQVHRSWWIARHAATDYTRDGRKHYFTLKNGQKVPISQANHHKLKAAGLS